VARRYQGISVEPGFCPVRRLARSRRGRQHAPHSLFHDPAMIQQLSQVLDSTSALRDAARTRRRRPRWPQRGHGHRPAQLSDRRRTIGPREAASGWNAGSGEYRDPAAGRDASPLSAPSARGALPLASIAPRLGPVPPSPRRPAAVRAPDGIAGGGERIGPRLRPHAGSADDMLALDPGGTDAPRAGIAVPALPPGSGCIGAGLPDSGAHRRGREGREDRSVRWAAMSGLGGCRCGAWWF
jgi:hypothetical protein